MPTVMRVPGSTSQPPTVPSFIERPHLGMMMGVMPAIIVFRP